MIALIAFALAARLWESGGDPEALPTPPGLGLDRYIPSSSVTLRAATLLPICPSLIAYAVIPAHDVSIDPSLVAAKVDGSRSVVVYSGWVIPGAFTAEIINALYLTRRLIQLVGFSRMGFNSTFVIRFTVPSDCERITDIYLAHIVDP